MHRSRNITRILCAAILSAGQIPLTFGQAAAEPATAPATMAATAPATMAATAPAAPATQPLKASSGISMEFKDAPMESVLQYLSKEAGFVIVKDTGIGVIEGRANIMGMNPVSPDAAILLLNTQLKMCVPTAYTAIQLDGKILKIIKLDSAAKEIVPIYQGADHLQIANTDTVITQIIPITSGDAGRLRQDLLPIQSDKATVTTNVATNSIVITDSSSKVRRYVEVIEQMSKNHPAASSMIVVQLTYASATAAAQLITNTFQQSGGGGQGGGGGGGGRGGGFGGFGGGPGGGGGFGGFGGGPGGGGGGAGAGGTTSGDAFTGRVLASADDRTNTVVVTGPSETLKQVEELLKQLDKDPSASQITFIYALKNGDAVNLQGVLNTLFGTGTGTTGTNRTTTNTSAFGSTGFSTTSGLGGGGGGRSGTGGSRSGGGGLGGGLGGSGFGSGGTSGTTAGNRSGTTAGGISGSRGGTTGGPGSSLTGQVFVVAEPSTNSLLITTNAKNKDEVLTILDELDRAVPQVLIKVLIAEVTHNNTDDIGVEYSIFDTRANGNGSKGGSNFNIQNAITSAASGAGPGGAVFSIAEENVTAALRALSTTNKVDVLSRPYILASDNQLAAIMSGQEVPYISASNVTGTGTIINTVAYQQIGIILNVTPHINPDGLVILDVNPQISTLDASTITVQAGVTAPIFNLRQAQSRVAIKNGETIIIGGLMQDSKNSHVDKIPLLGDIPGIGPLFQHRVDTTAKTELLIFLTPHVAQKPDVLKGMTSEERSGTKLTPGAVGPGVFDEHMHGMGLGATEIKPKDPFYLNNGATQPAGTQPAAAQPEPKKNDPKP